MRPCMLTFECHRGSRKRRTHILEKLYQRLKRTTGFIIHSKLMQKMLLRFQDSFSQVWCYLFVEMLVLKWTYRSSNCRRNGSSDQPFRFTFSKKENCIHVQKVAFLGYFERIFEKFQSVPKLWPEL